MKHRVLRLAAVIFVCTASVGLFAQAGDAHEEQLPVSLSLAYAGENIIHAGALVSLNVIPVKHGIQELVLSANTGFFVFRPFYTSLLLGARAVQATLSLWPCTSYCRSHRVVQAHLYAR